MGKTVEKEIADSILREYGFRECRGIQESFIHYLGEDSRVKLIFPVTLDSGRKLVVKILREDDDKSREQEQLKIEKQSIFSEFLRSKGIKTPARYMASGKYCIPYSYHGIPCCVTVEDWCGEEIKEINSNIAYKIGVLLAKMHTISLANNCEIGCGTLFSAAYWNDVDAFPEFCKLSAHDQLDQGVVERIKALREEKLERLRAVWDKLPKAAVQGDISVNNLVETEGDLTVFDYNNAGDEVLVSDLVMEGLLTAYEMDLPEGVPESAREEFFPALLRGYLSVRTLSEEECAAAWDIYTLYHGLWFSRVTYNEGSLEKLLEKGDFDGANLLLKRMLADMLEQNDGRFFA